jgi:hypothetical protein
MHWPLQVGRAGRFGTKGLAITFVSSASDSDVLNQVCIIIALSLSLHSFYLSGVIVKPNGSHIWYLKVQERFEVDIKELPEQIDTSTYSKCWLHLIVVNWHAWYRGAEVLMCIMLVNLQCHLEDPCELLCSYSWKQWFASVPCIYWKMFHLCLVLLNRQ